MSTAAPRVAVIGAGYAGLAAAVELAAAGIAPTVFESSRTLGGRARVVPRAGRTLDNGQHVLIGAYHESLRLMRRVEVDPDTQLERLPLTLLAPGALELRAPRWPAPLHLLAALLSARGLGWTERLAAIRFMAHWRRRRFRLPQDMSVTRLLESHAQPAALRHLLWEPLCVSALNTLPAQASAQVFLNVLRDSLAGGGGHDSDLLLPRCNLSQLFPEPAAAWLEARGGRVLRGAAIRRVVRADGGFRLEGDAQALVYSQIILAVAPFHAPSLLAGLPEAAASVRDIARLEYEPILTCYLSYRPPLRLPAPMLGGRCAHWLFDRGQLGGPPGLIAGVVSARGAHDGWPRETVAARVHEDVRAILGHGVPQPTWSQTIVEKRATFRCLPGLHRPAADTGISGLHLCGDYVASDYPATLESAVRSGIACARRVQEALA